MRHLFTVFAPFYARGIYGDAGGGGDRIMFVPWRVDPLHRPSEFVYYGMGSRLHAIDAANALWCAAPLALPLLATT